jgi:hypothetical protein
MQHITRNGTIGLEEFIEVVGEGAAEPGPIYFLRLIAEVIFLEGELQCLVNART